MQTIRLRQDSQELTFITITIFTRFSSRVFLLDFLWQTGKTFQHNLKCYSIKLYFKFYFIQFIIVTWHILSWEPLRYGKPLTRSYMFYVTYSTNWPQYLRCSKASVPYMLNFVPRKGWWDLKENDIRTSWDLQVEVSVYPDHRIQAMAALLVELLSLCQ